jgi:hypothetical protein
VRASGRSERRALDADRQETAAQGEGHSEQMTSSAAGGGTSRQVAVHCTLVEAVCVTIARTIASQSARSTP